jgi:RNA polymerase sigma-70 factor (ECF subfamily)
VTGHVGRLIAWLGAVNADTRASPDAALVAAWIAAGDEGACRQLVTRHRRRVIHVAAGVLGPRFAMDAEDVAQEAFARAFQRIETLRDRSQFGAWVTRMAFNLAIERRRLARLRHVHVEVVEALPGQAAEGDFLLRRAVEMLPVVPRTALHLHYWMGYSVAEIAELLQIPVNTVKSHLLRGREAVARRMERAR